MCVEVIIFTGVFDAMDVERSPLYEDCCLGKKRNSVILYSVLNFVTPICAPMMLSL